MRFNYNEKMMSHYFYISQVLIKMQSKFYSFYIAFTWIDTGLAQSANYFQFWEFHVNFSRSKYLSPVD